MLIGFISDNTLDDFARRAHQKSSVINYTSDIRLPPTESLGSKKSVQLVWEVEYCPHVWVVPWFLGSY